MASARAQEIVGSDEDEVDPVKTRIKICVCEQLVLRFRRAVRRFILLFLMKRLRRNVGWYASAVSRFSQPPAKKAIIERTRAG